ncbi:MAG: HAD family hydrolase [Candidatus Bathycorpusculaceae bacterium]
MVKVRTVSFDCGGTLYFEVEEDFIVFHNILRELGYQVNVNNIREALHHARCWWNAEKAKSNRVWNEGTWVGLIQRMLSHLNLPDVDKLAFRLRDGWLSKADFHAYDDAEPTLKELKNRGTQIIAISNVSSKKNSTMYLKKAGLLGYFDLIVASGDVGYEKPSPEIFKIASKLSKTPLKNMMHIGDKYEEDYLGARSAGMKAVLIDRKNMQKKRCKKISNLTELLNML